MKKVLALTLALMMALSMLTFASAEAKDTVIIATANEPTAFLTQDSTYNSNMAKDAGVLFNIHAYLAWMNENGEIVPWVATDWEPSEDGMSWTFHIRDDVYFHNGDKLTAEDVAFSYNQALATNPGLSANLLINLESAEVIDDTTVVFHLVAPFEGFPATTTSRSGCLISKKYFEEVGADGYNEHPIGCGAYKFIERISGQEIRLEAFDDYFLGAPAIKNVVIRVIPSVATGFISLRAGDVDVVNLADVASCKQLTEEDIATYITNQSTQRMYVTLNTLKNGNSVLKDDLNLRRAIQYGIDKEEIILGAMSGAGSVVDCCVPSFFTGAPDPGSYLSVDFDEDKAAEYLKASNWDGTPLVFYVTSGTVQEKAAQIIQGQLMNIGLDVEIKAVDSGTYTSMTSQTDDWDLSIYNTTSSLGDASAINTFYMEKETGPKSDRQAELDELCLKANVLSGQERKDVVAQVVNIANEEVIDIYIMVMDASIAFNKNLQGMVLNTNGTWRIQDWSWAE